MAFRVMTYNINSHHEEYATWYNVMRPNIAQALVVNVPDIVGFQSVESQWCTGEKNQLYMQRDLAIATEQRGWKFVRFDDPTQEPYVSLQHDEVVQANQNRSPMAYNPTRFKLIAHGTEIIKWRNVLSAPEWSDFREQHTYFTGFDTTGDGFPDHAHRFDPIVHGNWLILKHLGSANKLVAMNTHYKATDGENPYDTDDSFDRSVRYSDYYERVAEHTTERLIQTATRLKDAYGADGSIIMGDMGAEETDGRTDEMTSGVLDGFMQNYYKDAWSYVPHTGGPWATHPLNNGVDHIYVDDTCLDIHNTFHDWAPAHTGWTRASENYPLITILEFVADEERSQPLPAGPR